jgi:hypothetical protein
MTSKQYNEYQRQADVIEKDKKFKEKQEIPQQEISDEEIEKLAIEIYAESKKLFYSNHFSFHDLQNHFIKGMKCYREQLKIKKINHENKYIKFNGC